MNILVLGFYHHDNIGDESYKKTFPLLFPHYDFKFVDSLKEKDVQNCDAIVLGGGNVLRSQFIKQLAKIKDKKIFGFSIGMECKPTEDLSFFTHIYARDYKTLEFLKYKKISCSFIPDAAFVLEGNPLAGKKWLTSTFKKERLDLYSNVITIIINAYLINGNLNQLARDATRFINFSYEMARTADETSASFVFMPFGTQIPCDDRVSNAWIATKCKYWKKNHVIFNPLNYETALNVISTSNLVISSRLHSSIFSYVSGVPFLDITHHDKNKLFLELTGNLENSISFWNFNAPLFKEKINSLMISPRTINTELKEFVWNQVNAISFD